MGSQIYVSSFFLGLESIFSRGHGIAAAAEFDGIHSNGWISEKVGALTAMAMPDRPISPPSRMAGEGCGSALSHFPRTRRNFQFLDFRAIVTE
jgi:hypothetical protein